MDSSRGCSWQLLIVFSILCFQSIIVLADDNNDGSVFLIDSPIYRYLQSFQTPQAKSVSTMEVGAAVSILLGLPPPSTLSAASSAKLNEILLPNPFDKPQHVFLLEIGLAQEMVYPDSDVLTNAIKSDLVRDAGSVDIELPEKEGVAFFSMDGPDYDSYLAITDEDLNDFASSFGGLYKSDNVEPLNGELVIPLPSGVKMSLHLSKKADRKFATEMVYLFKMSKDSSQSTSNVAQLLGGHFDGIKALQEESKEEIAQQGMELLLTTLSKVVATLQDRNEGDIVTVVLFKVVHSSPPQRMLNVKYVSRPSSRLLEEVKSSSNSTAEAEVALVRITLAWVTGIVLIIATLIGVYLLLNMPLTRDTLLYSNVKLD